MADGEATTRGVPGGESAIDGAPRVILEARGLSAGYGGRAVFRDASLTVRAGELWFLVGPNGTGKTTLLRSILGIVSPLEGTLEVAPDIVAGRRIGFVPQRCSLRATLPMTVADFVRLGLTGTRIRGALARENVAWAISEVGLEGKARSDYWSLSGGQRQRALVARGLVRRPDLLILDEPTNGLDLPAEESFLGLVLRLNRERGITVVLVTHAIGIAARYATHAALFSGARLIAGSRDAVLTPANLREAYGVAVEIGAGGGGDRA